MLILKRSTEGNHTFAGRLVSDTESLLAVAVFCFRLCVLLRHLVVVSVFVMPLCLTLTLVAQNKDVPPVRTTKTDSTATAVRTVKSPRTAVKRALIPGWGQFYNDQIVKGIIVIAGQATLIGLAIHYDQKSKDFPSGSSEKERFVDDRNLTFWLMGGLTLLSMVDAYIDAQLYDFDTGPDLVLRLGTITNPALATTPVSLGMSLRATF